MVSTSPASRRRREAAAGEPSPSLEKTVGGSGSDCWYGLGVGRVMGREGVSDEMGVVTNGNVLAFGGVVVQLPTSGPAGGDVLGVLENILAISGGDEFDVIRIEEAVC